jgi:hypothetical protein
MRPFESYQMPKKPVFQMLVRDSAPIPTPYDPLIYTRMHEAWRFALHKTASGRDWIISDPVSGAKICTVSATYKGMPVTSGDLPHWVHIDWEATAGEVVRDYSSVEVNNVTYFYR